MNLCLRFPSRELYKYKYSTLARIEYTYEYTVLHVQAQSSSHELPKSRLPSLDIVTTHGTWHTASIGTCTCTVQVRVLDLYSSCTGLVQVLYHTSTSRSTVLYCRCRFQYMHKCYCTWSLLCEYSHKNVTPGTSQTPGGTCTLHVGSSTTSTVLVQAPVVLPSDRRR